MILQSIEIEPSLGPMDEATHRWVATARAEAKRIDCFDYIPSCPEMLHGYLSVAPGKRFCEWGSGIGIGIGIAQRLGFDATGIECNETLARRSCELLAQFELGGRVIHGSYHDLVVAADVVFVYCWPGQANAVRERFCQVMPAGTWLLFAEGAERISAWLLCHDAAQSDTSP